jgi:hypothetical protein
MMPLKISALNNPERKGAQPDFCAGSVLRQSMLGRQRSEASRNLSFSQCFGPGRSYLDLQQPASPQNLSTSKPSAATLSFLGSNSGSPSGYSFSQRFTLHAPCFGRTRSASSPLLSFYHCFGVSDSRLDRSRSANSRKLSFYHCFGVSDSRLGRSRSADSRKLSFYQLFTVSAPGSGWAQSAIPQILSFSQCFRPAQATHPWPLTTDPRPLTTPPEDN